MKIISWNVNGLRAVYKKGFWEWFGKIKADIVCLQETKIQDEQLSFDLARPKQNKNNIMFTPKEREQIDRLIDLSFTDSFRKFHKEGGYYTWWPYLANARQRNLGWRIDYAFVSKKLTPRLKKSFILSQAQGSDHCPIGIEIY